jgi:DNA-binding Lrp family transcriptional regulator
MKTKIDRFFTENYAQLVDVTKSYIRDLGKNLEAEGLISDAYIYVSQKKGITEAEIGRLTVGFIYRELYLWNSKTNRQGLLYSIEESTDEEMYDQTDRLILFIDIEDFENTLDRFERNVWEAFYYKGHSRKRELAEHFNIDPTSALSLIRDLKTKYKNYVGS